MLGYTSLRDAGDFNIMRYCLGLEYRRKGYNNGFKTTTWTCAIGVHTESSFVCTTGAAGYQIDPESSLTTTFHRAIFRDCTGRPNVGGGATSNGAKFAVVQDVYLDGCQFIHTETDCTTLRIAERIRRIRVKDTFLSRQFWFEPNVVLFPTEVRFERVQFGDGTHDPNYAIEQGKCNVLKISDSVLTGYKIGGIEWRSTNATYTLIAATNCDFNGKRDGQTTFDIARGLQGSGELNRSRKLLWLGNRRDNLGTGSAQFTDPNFPTLSSNTLGTTRDASIEVYEDTAQPSSGNVNWVVGDIIVNATPASSGYYGWVCTGVGAPGTWKQ